MKHYSNNWITYAELTTAPKDMTESLVIESLTEAQGDRGHKVYELSNHLGNVLATVSDKKLGIVDPDIPITPTTVSVALYYRAQVQTASDYYPFGWEMPSRKVTNGESYRYSFNGQEKSDIVEGNTTAEFWEYESRTIRRWNIDPRPVTSISPYSTFQNNPILLTDHAGDTAIFSNAQTARASVDYLNRLGGENITFSVEENKNPYSKKTKTDYTLSISLKVDVDELSEREKSIYSYFKEMIEDTKFHAFAQSHRFLFYSDLSSENKYLHAGEYVDFYGNLYRSSEHGSNDPIVREYASYSYVNYDLIGWYDSNDDNLQIKGEHLFLYSIVNYEVRGIDSYSTPFYDMTGILMNHNQRYKHNTEVFDGIRFVDKFDISSINAKNASNIFKPIFTHKKFSVSSGEFSWKDEKAKKYRIKSGKTKIILNYD